MNVNHKDILISVLAIALTGLMLINGLNTFGAGSTKVDNQIERIALALESLDSKLSTIQGQLDKQHSTVVSSGVDQSYRHTSAGDASDPDSTANTPPSDMLQSQQMGNAASTTRDSIDKRRYESIRNSIVQQARMRTNTIQSIFSSDEVKTLPDNERTELLRQITELINNGEVDAEQFLKGYAQ